LGGERKGLMLMPKLIYSPKIIQAVGAIPERIEEFVGRVNTGTEHISVARIIAPMGWKEPGQRPAFQEILVVLSGCLKVEHKNGII
jgi:hypothetical protein